MLLIADRACKNVIVDGKKSLWLSLRNTGFGAISRRSEQSPEFRDFGEVTLFAGVTYTEINIHIPDEFGFVTAGGDTTGTLAGVPSPQLQILSVCVASRKHF